MSEPVMQGEERKAVPAIEEFVDISTRSGVMRVRGYRVGDFAAHAPPMRADLFAIEYTVSHLPTGRSIAHGFRTIDRATAAMTALMRLRNDWAVISDEDLTTELRKKVETLVAPFGGRVGRRNDDFRRDPHLNGYTSHA